MEITTIIYSVVAFIFGILITYIIKKRDNNSINNKRITELTTENESLKSQISVVENKVGSISSESAKKIDEVKVKYESLLNEANAQCKKLDNQLKCALDGKIDESIKEQLAEVEKMKNKIKDLEEELEEAEDDLSDLKKKVKTKDADITELQDSLDKEQKNSKELYKELASVKLSLDEKLEELKLKMGSLAFVQEILSAPESNISDIKVLYENISEFKSFTSSQIIDCYATLKDKYITFDQGFENYKKHWQQRFDEWASVTKKSWINGKTTIAFVGEFSAGKTSIVNRILSQDDPSVPRLPVSTKATTAIATYIAGGPAVTYQFVTPDDKLKSISEETFTEKVSKEILDQVKGMSSLIKYFVMTYKNQNLKGLSILDTPGFNSNDINDAQRTMEVINECDALFWVFDVNAGTINRSSISIIKEYLNKPLYVVINKVDTKSDSEIQQVESLIKKTLQDEGLSVESFIRFSSKASLADIMTPIKTVKHLTEKEQYIADLGKEIQCILSILNEQIKVADDEYRDAEFNGQKIDDKFIQKMRKLHKNCNTAAEIPHFEEHLFRKDGYEMSQEEYQQLCNVLEQSCNHIIDMERFYTEKTNSAGVIQEKWTVLCETKNAWQSLNDVKSQFDKLSKKFSYETKSV